MAVYCQYYEINCLKCNDQLKKVRGCESEISGNFAGHDLERCPRRYVTIREVARLEAYAMYLKGFLPNSGTWLEQPNKFFEIMNFLQNIVDDIKEIESKKVKK